MSHKPYPITQVAEIAGATAYITVPEAVIQTLSYDSRKLSDTEHNLFFALHGRRDGHTYIPDAYRSGVRNFVISDKKIDRQAYPGANFLVVNNPLKALQDLAAYHRRQFTYPVIAITGSNGKTIVKEWLYQLLSPEYTIIRSPKSYNSQIGVPLSVWQMTDDHTLAIIETGISKADEMAALAHIIQPTIGVLTNIGDAHNEGFLTLQDKIAEKLTLFQEADLFIYSPKYLQAYSGKIPGKKQFTWCINAPADLEVIGEEVLENRYRYLRGIYQHNDVQCLVPFADAASVENAVCCWAVMLALGYHPAIPDERLEKLQPVTMRLELKTGINNCSVIDDSYSLDLASLTIALDFLKQQNQHPRRTLILSDIPQAGIKPEELYQQVAHLLESKQVDRLIGVGPQISACAESFPIDKQFYSSTEELLNNWSSLNFSDETILLKGARVFEFEKISKQLIQKVHETVLEINLNALEHNLNYYKSLLHPNVKLMVMVKAFSYGSGSFEIANLLQFNKVDYLAVAFADEGVALRKAGITLPIMVMNAEEAAYDTLIEHRLEPEIYSFRILHDFITILKQKNKTRYPVHLKIDTGMHRLGFMPHEVEALVSILNSSDDVLVKSVFSHLAASEDPVEDEFTQRQVQLFAETTHHIEKGIGYQFLRHIANTSGISRWPEAQLDMVRLGIGLYGIDSSIKQKSPLETVTTLKTSISQIKHIEPGETVGYNRRGKLPEGGKIATVKIGYADGYNRKLGNGVGKMQVNGHIVPTIGSICMDMCMLDITGVHAEEGDEVIVFGESVPVQQLADQLGTIPYEILTGISQRVKRVYYYE
ncbi:bifunctional UDP-N-acetylmuramoyl-tripeptide:D-alanyl-D-alanine ligase/alanine racemase [Pedobacter sp. BS3]|uniref:bifunctional UDP-N-acetylmuramoyl-tripeptide:D-alanyl-D-alanine ligase/alanine racemase n=1 Tax=Pedobacter sp. BS3 TaxID=2567937 RepID=UPI0011ECC48A|nr:bifunctional UDP-N-acetylmuramoyl-tripeptide:D-alanyl-D-alanine ligase/alanine racemase [Pedobacter sp. BS3]TZF83619.1 bifunctional UDP-N-acetylmuramoyl-tripeptide:D-alanyl-D-alanine ligase/alanine racemase [Pedobacter sp. BS3]